MSPRTRFRFPWRSKQAIGRAVDAELQFHIDMRTAELVSAGMAESDARAAAEREFGDINYTRRYCRNEDLSAERAGRLRDRVQEMLASVRYAVRSFKRTPAFTVVAVVTLALAVGANTSIFSVANALLLAPLPFGESDRLVSLFEHKVLENVQRSDMSAADLVDYRAMQRSLTGIAYFSASSAVIRDGDVAAVAVRALRVSANMFDVVQARAALGRTFAPGEDTPGKTHVAVLSSSIWQQMFGGDSSVVGRNMMINDESHVVIGVMPPAFGLGTREEVWLPLDLSAALADANRARKLHFLYGIGRLQPGVSLEAARADLASVARTLESRYPDANTGHLVTVLPTRTALAGNAARATFILAGAAALVLLVACANLGNMLLARAVTRRRELVLRAAIGASRGRLVRQLLTESLVLGVAGGGLGVALAAAGTRILVRASANALPPLAHVQIDWRVLTFALTVALALGVLIGLLPAFAAARLDLNGALKESARSVVGLRRGDRIRKALVVSQVAMAVLLLVAAGLLARSFDALRNSDLGFQPHRALAVDAVLRGPRYRTRDAFNQFYDAVFTRLRALPGVEAVGAVSGVPLVGSSGCGLAIEDRPVSPEQMPTVRCLGARGDYFKAIGTPLAAGRMFDDSDRPDGPQVTLINAAMARQYWPNENPIGKRIRLGPNPSLPWMTIIGVVGDQRQSDIESEPVPTAFEYDPQHGWGSLGIEPLGAPIFARPHGCVLAARARHRRRGPVRRPRLRRERPYPRVRYPNRAGREHWRRSRIGAATRSRVDCSWDCDWRRRRIRGGPRSERDALRRSAWRPSHVHRRDRDFCCSRDGGVPGACTPSDARRSAGVHSRGVSSARIDIQPYGPYG
jgi:predicted permease